MAPLKREVMFSGQVLLLKFPNSDLIAQVQWNRQREGGGAGRVVVGTQVFQVDSQVIHLQVFLLGLLIAKAKSPC